MRRRMLGAVVLVVAASAAACGGGGSSASSRPGAGAGQDGDRSTTTLDQGPFCVAIRALEALGTEEGGAAAATPDAVLSQNERFSALIATAMDHQPTDAPDDVAALLGDYTTVSDAIRAAGGDTSAAFAKLADADPDLSARLGRPDAHDESFTYFARECGTTPPG